MAMMTWMRRVSPYLLAAVLIAFIVSLAYFGTQPGSSGGGGRRGRGRDGRRGRRVGGDLRPRVPGGGGADPADGRRALDGGAAPDAAPPRAGGRAADRRAARRPGARPARASRSPTPELVEQIMRIGAFQEGGRFSRDRYVRLLAMTQPPMTPERLRGRLPGGAGAAAPAGPDRRRAPRSPRPRRDRPGRSDRSRVRAGYLLVPAGSGRGARGDRRRARDLLQGASRRVHPARAPARPGGGPAGGERAARRPSPTPTSRRRTRPAGASSSSRRARRSRTSSSRCPAWAAARPRTRPRPGPRRALARIRGGADFAQVAGRCRRIPSTASRGGDLGLIGRGRARARGRQGHPEPQAGRARRAGPEPLRLPRPQGVRGRAGLAEGAEGGRADPPGDARRRGAAEGAPGPGAGRPAGAPGRGRLRGGGAPARPHGARGGPAPPRRSGRGHGPGGRGQRRHLRPAARRREQPRARARGARHLPARRQRALARLLPLDRGPPGRAARRPPPEGARARRRGGPRSSPRPSGRARTRARSRARAARPTARSGRSPGPSRSATGRSARSWARRADARATGGVGGPVEGPGGFYVVKLLGRERPDARRLRGRRGPRLEARLLREKRARLWQAWLAAARAGAKIEINRQLLSDG